MTESGNRPLGSPNFGSSSYTLSLLFGPVVVVVVVAAAVRETAKMAVMARKTCDFGVEAMAPWERVVLLIFPNVKRWCSGVSLVGPCLNLVRDY